MYLFVNKNKKSDKNDTLSAINSFEYHNKEMHKNLFVRSEIRKERKRNITGGSNISSNDNSLLTNIRNESDTAITELNEKIPQNEVDEEKQKLKNQFRKIQLLCNNYGYGEKSKRIPKIVVKNVYIDSYNISKKLDFLPIGDNQSIKDAAVKSRENGINEDINENSPKTLISLDKALEQKQQESKNSPEVAKMRNPVQTFLRKLVNNHSFCMRVPESKAIFESIKAEHFKNQFETGAARGVLNFDKRRWAARKLFGIDRDTVEHMEGVEFEKYGYLDSPDVKSGPVNYGRIKIVFNKKPMLNRVTLTVGDSFNRLNKNKIMASRVMDPKIESIQGVVNGNYSYLKVIYDLIRKNRINPKMNPMDISKKIRMKNSSSIINSETRKDPKKNRMEYFELQYHGKLTMNDIESYQIPGEKDIRLGTKKIDENTRRKETMGEVLSDLHDVRSILGDDSSISSKDFSKFVSRAKSYVGYWGKHGNNKHRDAYLDMSRRDASTLTKGEAEAMDEYTTDSAQINRALRSGQYADGPLSEEKLNERITDMHMAFMKHKLPKDFISYRGVDDGIITYLLGLRGFDKEQLEFILDESGHIDHDKLYKNGIYKLIEGLEFEDKAFVSTSTNEFFARRWSNELVNRANAEALKVKGDAKSKNEASEMVKGINRFKDVKGSHLMRMKIPKGTRAMFTDTMYTRGNDSRGQNELTLDAGYTYRIDKIKPMSVGRYCFEVSVIG